jgi:hypothetical protein
MLADEGKTYSLNQCGELLVWRCLSRRTEHWVLMRNPPEAVRDALLIARGEP